MQSVGCFSHLNNKCHSPSKTNSTHRYITEISPPQYRGTLASLPQLVITIGLATGYFICYGTVKVASSLSWRLPFGLQAIFAFIFTLSALLFSPESPRWLSQVGKHQEALAVWEKLDVLAAEREKSEEDSDNLAKPVEWKDLLSVFAKSARKQTALGVFLGGMQQLSGIDGVLYVCFVWPPCDFRCGLTRVVRSASISVCWSYQ